MTSLADILLLLTNTGAVSEFLMIQHMKDLPGMYNPKSDSHTLSFPVRGQARFRPQSPLLVVRGDDIGPLYRATTSVLCTRRRHRSFVRGDDIGPLYGATTSVLWLRAQKPRPTTHKRVIMERALPAQRH